MLDGRLAPCLTPLGFRRKCGVELKIIWNSGGLRHWFEELMDVFLPPPSEPLLDCTDLWRRMPILDQPQFGPYLRDSALLTLAEVDLRACIESGMGSTS
jgi:hypothetical protein